MSEDQFEKLFKYMRREFSQVRYDMDSLRGELKTDIDRVYNLLDDDLKRRETDEQERLVMGHQLSRHENWIETAAAKLNVSYDHEG